MNTSAGHILEVCKGICKIVLGAYHFPLPIISPSLFLEVHITSHLFLVHFSFPLPIHLYLLLLSSAFPPSFPWHPLPRNTLAELCGIGFRADQIRLHCLCWAQLWPADLPGDSCTVGKSQGVVQSTVLYPISSPHDIFSPPLGSLHILIFPCFVLSFPPTSQATFYLPPKFSNIYCLLNLSPTFSTMETQKKLS